MDAYDVTRIRNNPRFLELERKRGNFSTTLCILMLVIYFSFIFAVAFARDFLSQPIAGGPLTLAFPLGLGVILSAIALTAVYVVRANSEFDRLTNEIVGQAAVRPVPTGATFAAGVR